jgi:hypothetical protein
MSMRTCVGLGLCCSLALPRLASADGTKDTDCKGDRVCVQGQCADPAPSSVQTPAPVAPPQIYVQPGAPVAPPPMYAPYPYVYAVPQWHYAHPAMRWLGIALFITGAVVDVAGTVVYSAAASSTCSPGGPGSGGYGNGSTCAGVETGGEGLWVGGGALTAAGLVLWLVGGSVVPGPEPVRTGWLRSVVPYVAPAKGGGGRAGLSVAF